MSQNLSSAAVMIGALRVSVYKQQRLWQSGSSEPSLVAYSIITRISYAGPYDVLLVKNKKHVI